MREGISLGSRDDVAVLIDEGLTCDSRGALWNELLDGTWIESVDKTGGGTEVFCRVAIERSPITLFTWVEFAITTEGDTCDKVLLCNFFQSRARARIRSTETFNATTTAAPITILDVAVVTLLEGLIDSGIATAEEIL